MFPSYSQYEVVTHDRRRRFEAAATRHRLLGSLRRRHHVSTGASAPGADLRTFPLGRTPGELDRQAA